MKGIRAIVLVLTQLSNVGMIMTEKASSHFEIQYWFTIQVPSPYLKRIYGLYPSQSNSRGMLIWVNIWSNATNCSFVLIKIYTTHEVYFCIIYLFSASSAQQVGGMRSVCRPHSRQNKAIPSKPVGGLWWHFSGGFEGVTKVHNHDAVPIPGIWQNNHFWAFQLFAMTEIRHQ